VLAESAMESVERVTKKKKWQYRLVNVEREKNWEPAGNLLMRSGGQPH